MTSLNVAAAELVNLLLQEVEEEDDATPEDWQAKCLQARYARAASTGRRIDDLNGGHVRFTEMDLDLPAPPPPQTHVISLSQEERDMLLSALEAYALGAGRTQEQRRSYQRLSDRLAVTAPQTHAEGSQAAIDVLAERHRQVAVEDFRVD